MLSMRQVAKLSAAYRAKAMRTLKSVGDFATGTIHSGHDVEPTEAGRGCPAVISTSGHAIGSLRQWLTLPPSSEEVALALARAEANIDGLLAQLEQMHEALADTREQRDKWQAQAEANQKLVCDIRSKRQVRWPWRKAG